MGSDKIWLFDTTLRDGGQTRGVDFSRADKVAIAHALDDIGIARAWQSLRLEKADKSTSTILKLPASDPIAHVKRYITNAQNNLVYFADVRYRADAIQYNMELKI